MSGIDPNELPKADIPYDVGFTPGEPMGAGRFARPERPSRISRLTIIVGAMILLCALGVAGVMSVNGSREAVPAAAPTTTPAASAPSAAPSGQADQKELAYGMMCLGKYGAAAKAADAPREAKVALCGCIVEQAGLTATSPNYEAEMTRCFAKMLNQPYQQSMPENTPSPTAAPLVSLPGAESAPMAAPSPVVAPVSDLAAEPKPVSPYVADLVKVPADKRAALREACLVSARAKARELGSDEELFLSMNANYIDFCLVTRARSEGLLPPDDAMQQAGEK